MKMQRTICTESDEGLGVCGEASEGRNCVGQVDPAEYQNLVPDLMEGFIYTTAEVAFHPLTHILSQISVVLLSGLCSRVVCPGPCVCDAEDKGCRLSHVSQVLTGR